MISTRSKEIITLQNCFKANLFSRVKRWIRLVNVINPYCFCFQAFEVSEVEISRPVRSSVYEQWQYVSECFTMDNQRIVVCLSFERQEISPLMLLTFSKNLQLLFSSCFLPKKGLNVVSSMEWHCCFSLKYVNTKSWNIFKVKLQGFKAKCIL